MGKSYDKTLVTNSCMWTVWKGEKCRCEFSIRPSYKGDRSLIFHGTAWQTYGQAEKVVVKVTRKCCAQKDDWAYYLDVHRECKRFAAKFNAWLEENTIINYTVEFVNPRTVCLDEYSWVTSRLYKKRFTEEEVVLMEERLPECWTWIDERGIARDAPDISLTIAHALCHFVYKESRGSIAICNLKGHLCGKKIIFTVPTMHSIDRRYGDEDKGVRGIKTVWTNHECSDICPHDKLEPTAPGLDEDYLLSSDVVPDD